MAMKKLQNNYTTPEQSKRLLELGVPANSADCFYSLWRGDVCADEPFGPFIRGTVSVIDYQNDIPCWSVGRLIEIYHICDKPGCSFSFHVCFPNLISEMIYKIAEAKEHGWINFSKLED